MRVRLEPRASAVLGLLLVGSIAAPLAAQRPVSPAATSPDSARHQLAVPVAHSLRGWEVGAVVGGVALASALDRPMQRTVQRHRSSFLGDLAGVFRQQGEPWYYISVSVGVFGAGVLAGSPDLRRAGRRLVASVAGSGLTTYALKMLIGRSRPNERVGAFEFHPFTTLQDSAGVETRGSFPSGHATAAFAVATSLADDLHSPVASVLLYSIATGAAWSRIYDDRHWLSDTMFGAMLGITTAKIVSGRWRVFGWRPPAMMVRPTGELALQWTVPLPPISAGW